MQLHKSYPRTGPAAPILLLHGTDAYLCCQAVDACHDGLQAIIRLPLSTVWQPKELNLSHDSLMPNSDVHLEAGGHLPNEESDFVYSCYSAGEGWQGPWGAGHPPFHQCSIQLSHTDAHSVTLHTDGRSFIMVSTHHTNMRALLSPVTAWSNTQCAFVRMLYMQIHVFVCKEGYYRHSHASLHVLADDPTRDESWLLTFMSVAILLYGAEGIWTAMCTAEGQNSHVQSNRHSNNSSNTRQPE